MVLQGTVHVVMCGQMVLVVVIGVCRNGTVPLGGVKCGRFATWSDDSDLVSGEDS